MLVFNKFSKKNTHNPFCKRQFETWDHVNAKWFSKFTKKLIQKHAFPRGFLKYLIGPGNTKSLLLKFETLNGS